MTLLDSKLLSEYACQRTAGAAARVVSRELAQRDAAIIEQPSGIQEKDLIDKSAEMSALDQNIRAHDSK
ncbi:hypothetical protein EOS_03710 [Caballeronia mineralivorans PML1(12)]|uniref:Uncharacterized protein n=1 Tax=Caballeronia mineralivorans PML1(12) TaxID=908627 RepID=A0A0J1G5P9_9BURK|nr:hypothetical protein [Caballeronia mineralivorans]KLU27513.1 hypothetical protein EOS_03710 [Caballeronia mineralivorans PML1(12)]